ncbi:MULTISPECIES: Lsr2 family DNA-binding protein [Streptomyces]
MSTFKVVQHVELEVNGKTYTGQVSDQDTVAKLQKLATAYEKASDALISAMDEAGVKQERGSFSVQAAKPKTKSGTGATPDGVDPTAVREWAAANNVQVNDRGRVPKSVIDQYLAAKK